MTATDIEGMRLALAESPADDVTRLAIADWCEEHGDGVVAECWRWFVAKGVSPQIDTNKDQMNRDMVWWFCSRGSMESWAPHQLPEVWIKLVDDNTASYSLRLFRSVNQAYHAAVKAWARMTTKQRARCWKWEPRP